MDVSINNVQDGQDRMREEHAGPRISHDFSDLFTHMGLVTVDGAFAALGFLLVEGTLVELDARILQQGGTFFTERAPSVVFVTAIDVYHCLQSPLLSLYSAGHYRAYLAGPVRLVRSPQVPDDSGSLDSTALGREGATH